MKTSIRFFEDVPVCAVWNDESSKWWFCAADIAEALTKTVAPRQYWNTLKRRKSELSSICLQLKLRAKDGRVLATEFNSLMSYALSSSIMFSICFSALSAFECLFQYAYSSFTEYAMYNSRIQRLL